MSLAPLIQELDRWHDQGRVASFWLRDDDAIVPTAALDQLLALGERHGVPLVLAVIPQPTGSDLADRLAMTNHVEVAVHGWAHTNHAPDGQKSRELGGRASGAMLADLSSGLAKLRELHGPRLVPLLVPPWNRIDADLIPHLAGIGYRALSVFGAETARPAIATINTHVDLIDWRGNRGGRDTAALVGEMVARLRRMALSGGSLGLLTHHLVHDAEAWAFLDAVFAATAAHPGCRWRPVSDLMQPDQTLVS